MKTVTLTRRCHNSINYILIYCKYDKQFIRIIKKFSGIQWSRSESAWYITEYEGCVKDLISCLKKDFRIDATGVHSMIRKTDQQRKNDTSVFHRGSGNSVRLTIDPAKGKLIIKFTGWYQKRWISELKQYGRPYYNPQSKEWHIRANRIIIDSLVDYFSREGLKVMIKKEVMSPSQLELRNKEIKEIRLRELDPEIHKEIDNFQQFLKEQRYSRHTLDSYLTHIELFFKYFKGMRPEDITNDDLGDFMNLVVIKHGFSSSFQNQLLSAIKAYYSYHGRGNLDLDKIKRPRKSRPLPQVLSKEEVTGILQATRNIKHRLLLSIIYSCGLRRSEVINIRLNDLNRDRKTLHIRSGKGNVDRVVPVSDKIWSRVDEYLIAYSPSVYLFEGQSGGRYSAGSVYHVFCQAAKRAGIEKDIGVHSLRHSYATHLHEGGLDIRYIQELLGHKSSRTTEIYTHVSRRNLLSINNPLDDLDIH
jgi:site-specific recombinase XerD